MGQDTACVIRSKSHIAIFTPKGSPRIFNNPVSLFIIANSQYFMIKYNIRLSHPLQIPDLQPPQLQALTQTETGEKFKARFKSFEVLGTQIHYLGLKPLFVPVILQFFQTAIQGQLSKVVIPTLEAQSRDSTANPPLHPQEQQPFADMTQSTSYCSEKSTKTLFQMKLNDSIKAAPAKLQHEPQLPQYLTEVTAPYVLQSIEASKVF
ncbi:hypothetical protein TTHERM_000881409 (macronuclear) [Tetrahymena thermophila SB210]|uniref:Uncharacterized protein n=1 Tax=Tetrahymena thermophila (strain SB210) TaxID=312017 RepID=W7X4W6_TETTS|nr:hypothetical protein TTHERM_000881409 [Tetrahymena thermophila SB210]EWS74370.1 hypothetical protein TTHERM_000881409 [Tetrahymena thermophila SB210]|eukprot:XP_012653099.1 hypothetical protein TTHERM_000881409 [Tetrahymena thermophila SB210]